MFCRASWHLKCLGENIKAFKSCLQFEFLFDSTIPFIYYFQP
jgi:hypothetical protein